MPTTATHSAASKSSTAARVANVISAILAGMIIVAALALVAGKPLGFHAFAVQSGSMEPAYSTGDLIYVKEVDPSSIAEGDVITYLVSGDSVVTHRVIEVVQDVNDPSIIGFRTQGDANATPDGSIVHEDNLIGTPILTIPLVGYIAGFIQTPPGTYIALAVCALVVFLVFLPDIFSKDEEEEVEKISSTKPQTGRHQGTLPRTQRNLPAGQMSAMPQARPGYQAPRPAQAARPTPVRQGAVPARTNGKQLPPARVAATTGGRASRTTAGTPRSAATGAPRTTTNASCATSPRTNAAHTHHAPARGGANNPRLAKARACPSATGIQPAATANKPAAANARPRGGRSA